MDPPRLDPVSLKVLVPHDVAATLKSLIHNLNWGGARTSLRGDLCTGTQERTVFIRGPFSAVSSATCAVLHRFFQEEENFCRSIPQGLFEQSYEEVFWTARIVIPVCLSAFLESRKTSLQAGGKASLKLLGTNYTKTDHVLEVSGIGKECVLEAVVLSLKTLVEHDSDGSPAGNLHYNSPYHYLVPTDQPSQRMCTPFPTTMFPTTMFPTTMFPTIMFPTPMFPGSLSSPEQKKRAAAETSQQQGHELLSLQKPSYHVALKVLISQDVAEALIGANGALIKELQRASGAVTLLSRTTDFYPGTQERTMLIRGSLAAVSSASSALLILVFWKEERFCRSIPRGLFEGCLDRNEALTVPIEQLIVIPEWISDFLIEWSKSQQAGKPEREKVKFKLLDPDDHTAVALNLEERVVKVSGNGMSVGGWVISSLETMVEYDLNRLRYQNMTVNYSDYPSYYPGPIQVTFQERNQPGYPAYQHLTPTDQPLTPSQRMRTPVPTMMFPDSCSSPEKEKRVASRKAEAETNQQHGRKELAFPKELQYEELSCQEL